jgi:hypothetical protein
MNQNNAREAMQRAKRDYPEYTWEMESGFSSGEFILHGQKKDKSSRNRHIANIGAIYRANCKSAAQESVKRSAVNLILLSFRTIPVARAAKA